MLFLSPDRKRALQQAIRTQDPDITALVAALKDTESCDSAAEKWLNCIAIDWLEDNATSISNHCKELLALVQTETLLDLGRANQTLGMVLAYEFSKDLLVPAERAAMASEIANLARSFLDIREGNPHIVTNNWFMLTHGACLLGCLVANGELATDGSRIDLEDLQEWALERCDAFCQHFGNAGLYHEGSGYICYTLCMLAPVILALQNRCDLDLTSEHTGLRKTLHSMMVGVSTAKAGEKITAYMLDWNDAGRHAGSLNPYIPLLLLSPKELQPALLHRLRVTLGAQGERRLRCAYKGLPMALAIWPLDMPSGDPETDLPRWAMDNRHGLGYWRSAWDDRKAVVFGWYARTTYAAPGHSHDDAGSIRMFGLGQTWICGGGQARGKAIWQSVLTHLNEEDRPRKHPNAFVFCKKLTAEGGCVGLEMRQVLDAYCERYLTWSSTAGFPIALAVLDLLDEHRLEPRPYTWNLSFPSELCVDIDADGAGFRVTNKEKLSLVGRFLLDVPDQLNACVMPSSTRTFSGGKRVEYIGDHYISGEFHHRRNLRILVAMTLINGGQAHPDPRLVGRDIQFANGQTWKDPYKGAIIESADFRTMLPNLQRYPSGSKIDH
ncbi:MAG: hypothetical protein LR015_08985 [Verrucomicrobia bacterium]|nr:hypothetical protein [Verrucomicrobiota bacterium]